MTPLYTIGPPNFILSNNKKESIIIRKAYIKTFKMIFILTKFAKTKNNRQRKKYKILLGIHERCPLTIYNWPT